MMQLIQCVSAYQTICEMIQQDWEFNFAKTLASLMLELEPYFKWFSIEEMKLVAKYGKKDTVTGKVNVSESGIFDFPNNENMQLYQSAIQKLESTIISGPHYNDVIPPIRIRIDWFNSLRPFMTFKAQSWLVENTDTNDQKPFVTFRGVPQTTCGECIHHSHFHVDPPYVKCEKRQLFVEDDDFCKHARGSEHESTMSGNRGDI